ncbi:MAG: 3-keto-5-aminohexanoate cleavage protein [Rhodobacteraceae bacterium]|nr:3-keto-5-aminohexanoate cleavage protein [Paracoccaceae bacterium]
MTRPLVMVAPNGARRGKADHPALPVTIPDTVETAVACHRAGADALHLHVRDEEGRHSLDPGRYREAIAELQRAVPEMGIQITTESAGIYDVDAQLNTLKEVAPKWASISIREIARSSELADHVYGTCAANGTRVVHILYDKSDANLLEDWQAQGIVRQEQSDVIMVLGRYSDGQQSRPEDVAPFLRCVPPNSNWMLCAFGASEHACLREAARLGGAVRVGFENSLTAADGRPHLDNAASVAALVAQLERIAA